MKKLFTTLTAVASAAVLFVSCGKQTPDEQFKAAIRNGIMDSTEKIAKGVSDSLGSADFSNLAANTKTKLSLDESSIALIQGLLASQVPGMDFSWFKSLNFDVNVGLNGNNFNEVLGIGLNDVNILTFDIIGELENSNAYFQIPELLKKYFKVDGKEMGMQELFKIYLAEIQLIKSAPSNKVFTGFIDEILTAVLSGVKDVERTEETLTAGLVDSTKKVSANYDSLLFKLNPEYANATAENVKNTIIESKNFRSILEWILPAIKDIGGEEYTYEDATHLFAENFASIFEKAADLENVSFTVYADKKSNFQGFKVNTGFDAFKTVFTQKGKEFGFDMKVSDESAELFAIGGFGSYSGGKMTGDFEVSSNGENAVIFSTDKLDVEGLKSLKSNGAVTLRLADNYQNIMKEELRSSLGESAVALAKNLALTIKMEQPKATEGSVEFILGDGEKASYVSLKADSKYQKGSKVEIPAESISVTSIGDEESMNLISSIKMDEICENLKKANLPEEYVQLISMYGSQAILSLIH